MQQVTDWGQAFFASTLAALQTFFNKIPQLIGFAVILIVGWLVASGIAALVARVLRSVRFNELADRSGLTGFVRNMGMETDASGFIAFVAKWFVRLITLVVAFDALGLPAVSDVLRQILLFLPNVVVALVVLVLGGIAANAVGRLVSATATEAELGNPELLATLSRIAIWLFAIVIAVNQIGVAQTLVNILFMAIVGAVALALGLAFGLGARDTAGEIVRNWYERSRSRGASAKLERAGQVTEEITTRGTTTTPPPPRGTTH